MLPQASPIETLVLLHLGDSLQESELFCQGSGVPMPRGSSPQDGLPSPGP